MTLLAIIALAQVGASQPATAPPVGAPLPPVTIPVPPGPFGQVTMSDGAFNPRASKPMSYPGAWVMTGDYPAESLRENEQGTTAFTVTVDVHGRVKDCRVTASSGSPRLDETTCRLVTQRARFSPATDAQDKPIEGSYANRFRWVLPQVTPPEPGMLVMTYVVQASGDVTDCKITLEGGAAASLGRSATFCSNTRKMKPYLDAEKKPVARKVKMTSTVTVE